MTSAEKLAYPSAMVKPKGYRLRRASTGYIVERLAPRRKFRFFPTTESWREINTSITSGAFMIGTDLAKGRSMQSLIDLVLV